MFDFGLYTQVSDSGPHGPLVVFYRIWQFASDILLLFQHSPPTTNNNNNKKIQI